MKGVSFCFAAGLKADHHLDNTPFQKKKKGALGSFYTFIGVHQRHSAVCPPVADRPYQGGKLKVFLTTAVPRADRQDEAQLWGTDQEAENEEAEKQ